MPIELETSSKEEIELLQRIDKGKHSPADFAALRKIMREEPGRLSKVADLCAVAFRDAIRLAIGDSVLAAELVKDHCELLRAELGYAQALPLEKLMIDEIMLCWLRHYMAECRYTDARKESISWEQDEYWQKKIAATQRRYLRAIETHARVGKLLRAVTVQLNIGEKQVNIAAGSTRASVNAAAAAIMEAANGRKALSVADGKDGSA